LFILILFFLLGFLTVKKNFDGTLFDKKKVPTKIN